MVRERSRRVGRTTYVDSYVGHWFDVIGKVDTPTIASLRRAAVSNDEMRPTDEQRTSGDSSSRITAPRVSTWIAFALGSVGPDILALRLLRRCSSATIRTPLTGWAGQSAIAPVIEVASPLYGVYAGQRVGLSRKLRWMCAWSGRTTTGTCGF